MQQQRTGRRHKPHKTLSRGEKVTVYVLEERLRGRIKSFRTCKYGGACSG